MKQYNQQRKYKPRIKPYDVEIQVKYVPFPSEATRREAYYTHAKLFLRAKERMLREEYKKIKAENSRNYSNGRNAKGRPATARFRSY